MPRKQGYITKSFTFDEKRYYVIGKNEKEALKNMVIKQRDLEEGKVSISSNMTVKAWCEQCLDKYKTNLSDTSFVNYRNRMNHWIVEKIGQNKLSSIKPLHCQDIMNQLEGYSKFQINAVAQMLFFIFDKAIDNELIIRNPAESLTKPRGTSTRRRSITHHEREYVLAVAETNNRFIYFLFMIFCGCRPSEAAEIKGMDIKQIDGRNILHIRGKKTANADRLVPIPDYLFYRIPNINKFDYFVTNANGKKMSQGNYTDLWRLFKRELNINMGCKVYRNELIPPYPLATDLTPYCFRHTYCTDLQKAGIYIRTAQYLMGHSDISLTANIYTHADNETILTAADILASYQKGTTPGTTLNRYKSV